MSLDFIGARGKGSAANRMKSRSRVKPATAGFAASAIAGSKRSIFADAAVQNLNPAQRCHLLDWQAL
jgi:hypothetical protein